MTKYECSICGKKAKLKNDGGIHNGLILGVGYCSESCKTEAQRLLTVVRDAWDKEKKV